MDLIYSAQRSGFAPGAVYQNPRYWSGRVDTRYDRVIIIGHWPEIAAAYRAAGIEVIAEPDQAPLPVNGALDDAGGDGTGDVIITKKHFGNGRWFVVRGDERISGPYGKDEIDAAVEREKGRT